jgi:uncharacterized protein
MPTMRRTTELPVSAEAAYDWHTRPGAFERLSPPWQHVRVLERAHGVDEGERMVMRVRRGPFSRRWIAVHEAARPGSCFADDQVSGPFADWRHIHRFTPAGADRCVLEDEVHYELPLGAAGEAVAGGAVARDLERLFAFRHQRTRDDLSRHSQWPRPLRVAVTGATGMIGTEIAAYLRAGGHEVVGIVRGAPRGPEEIRWDPSTGRAPRLDKLEGLDGLVHLAGENIGGGRWTGPRRASILSSRVDGTTTIASALAALERPPRLFISMSGIGHYGDRGDEVLGEESGRGTGFLTDVTDAWEQATAPAWQAGVPTVILRTGVILSARGGALHKMLPAFLAGVGGPIGGGEQWMSWLSLDDYLGIVQWLLQADALAVQAPAEGPLVVNATSPEPVQDREFVHTLGRVLRRPSFAPLPATAVRGLCGEMGVQTLLYSQRALPRRLQESGYRFIYPRLEGALRLELGRLEAGSA